MENFQRKRLMPMAYVLIVVSLAAVTIPTGQSMLTTEAPFSATKTSQTSRTLEQAPASLDGMRLDTIPARPATSDLPPAVTKVVA